MHSLERRRSGRAFVLDLTLRRSDNGQLITQARHAGTGARAYVVGAGDRTDLQLPGGDGALLPRHVAIVVVPHLDGAHIRAVSLHPERGLHITPLPPSSATPGAVPSGSPSENTASTLSGHRPLAVTAPPRSALDDEATMGGAVARGGMHIAFDGMSLEVRATLEVVELDDGAGPQLLEVFPVGSQLSFFSGPTVRTVTDVIASISGPGGGGHAIPALLSSSEEAPVGGTVVLRTRTGVHRVEVNADEIRRGLLVGRSRRCVLGRGFDENDGLSRVHALILAVDDGVMAFDLASRYGLRDVSRPARVVAQARLDDGIGCLVYGAGLLTYEPA